MAVGSAPAGTSERFARAYGHLRGDPELQFAFSAPAPVHAPGWLVALGRLLAWLWPYLTWVVWAGLAAIVIGAIALIARAWLRRRRRRADHVKAGLQLGPEGWRPSPAQARALLKDADALAAEHRFDEAIHMLLLRSVEDIQGRLPGLIRPALTSRDIAGLGDLPDAARASFATLVQTVERSLFGGGAVDAEGFAASRRVYEAFAFPQTWSHAGAATP